MWHILMQLVLSLHAVTTLVIESFCLLRKYFDKRIATSICIASAHLCQHVIQANVSRLIYVVNRMCCNGVDGLEKRNCVHFAHCFLPLS